MYVCMYIMYHVYLYASHTHIYNIIFIYIYIISMFLRWLDRARHPGALEPLPQQPASLEASRLAGRGAGAHCGEGTTPGADHVG